MEIRAGMERDEDKQNNERILCIKKQEEGRPLLKLQGCTGSRGIKAYMLSLPDSPGDSRNLVKSPDLPVGRMNLPDFYHIEIRLKSTLMAENPNKTSPFSV